MIDSMKEEFEAFETYSTVREELSRYNKELLNKREIVCLSKIDAMTEEEIDRLVNSSYKRGGDPTKRARARLEIYSRLIRDHSDQIVPRS